ncbi:unnamed protein product [Lactuca saligna]|uniref:Vps16 N-terminal domain-containing protein n=1 Tax=Lactuca saligna TaxID=75948 RepID=A0AA35V5H3_LACSI|nr:unnamed protein product [Lactuca saligna]
MTLADRGRGLNEIKAEPRHQAKDALLPSAPIHLSTHPPSLTYATPVKEIHLIPLLLGSLPKGTFFTCLLSQKNVSSFCLPFDIHATSRLQSGFIIFSLYNDFLILFLLHSTLAQEHLVWCGMDSVLLYWDDMLLAVGPYGDLVLYLYDEPIILIPECNGARILSNLNMEFLQRVPASTKSVFKIGST